MTTNDKTTKTMRKHFPLLFMMLALGFAGFPARAQVMTQTNPPIGAPPDNKMLGGTSVGSGLNGISSPDLFNGSMNITVPIFNFGNSGAGVSLSYNTAGVRTDEFASRAGLHWNLNCGGSIVRIVRGLPDEFLVNSDSLLVASSFYQDDHYIRFPNKEMHLYGRWFADVESQAKLNASNAYTDKEYDEFDVAVGGLSFKFSIGKNLKVFTSTPGNIKVQLLADNVPVTNISQLGATGQHALDFKITVPGGDAYYFQPYQSKPFDGRNYFWDWSHLYTDTISPSTYFPASYPTSWRLAKIVMAEGQEVRYQYATTGMGVSIIDLSDASYLDYYIKESVNNGVVGTYFLGVPFNEGTPNYRPLLEIDYPGNVQVHFQYDTQHWNAKGDYFLNEIKIASGQDCKRFRFYVNQDAANKRYFLDSIKQVSCDGTQTEPYYRFTYNPIIKISNISLPGYPPLYDTQFARLPRRLNSGQDLYGYYNNDSMGVVVQAPQTTGPGITVPKHHPDIGGDANYGNQRAYDARYAQAGLLTAVQNAYGHTDSFFYGANVISSIPLADSVPTDNSFIGTSQPDGVRVDSIASTDTAHPGQRLLTTFDYAGGQIFMPGGYFHYPDYIDSVTGNWGYLIYQSMFLTPHQLVNGANHGYSTVDVKNYADGQLLSRRVLTYTNMQDASSGNKPRYYKVPGSKEFFQYPYTDKQYLKDWEIGLPLSITDYDQDNHIVKKVTNQYDFSSPDLSASAYLANTCTIKTESGRATSPDGFTDFYYPYKRIFTDNYYPFKGKATLASIVTQKYLSDTRFVTDTVWYTYDDHNNLSSTVTQGSDGGKTATEMIYNYDVDGPQFATGHPGYTAHPGTTLYNMSDSGLEVPVSTERWKLLPGTRITDPYGGTVLQNNNELLSAYITGYQYQGGKLWTKGLWNTQTGSPLSYTGYTGLVSGVAGNPYGKVLNAYNTSNPVEDFMKTSQATLFDAKGNPLESQLQGQDQYKAMIWDTASGQQLAEAANCRYSDIAYTSFENNLSESNFTVSYAAAIISATDAVTGSQVLSLWKAPVQQGDPGSAVIITGTQNLQAGKPYILSFWVSVTGSNPPPTLKVGSQVLSLASQVVYTKGSWKKYLVRFTPSAAGKITITGTTASSRIDELRLFPADARMQSSTYEPLFGKSSETDASGRIIYYRYDPMGRQDLVLDMDGNVLSKTDYHVAR